MPGPHYSGWSVPEEVPSANVTGADAPNGISRDGLSLYFQRRNPGTGEDMYVVHRPDLEAEWGEPVRLPDGENTNANEQPSDSCNPCVLLLSRKGDTDKASHVKSWLILELQPARIGGYDTWLTSLVPSELWSESA